MVGQWSHTVLDNQGLIVTCGGTKILDFLDLFPFPEAGTLFSRGCRDGTAGCRTGAGVSRTGVASEIVSKTGTGISGKDSWLLPLIPSSVVAGELSVCVVLSVSVGGDG